jgi:hypothetical protein
MCWRLLRLSSASIPISSRRGFFWRSRFTIRWGPIPDLVRALSSEPETQRNKTIQDPKPANSDNQGHAVIWIFEEPPVPFLRDFRIRELLVPVHRESKNCQSWLFQKSKILGGYVTFSIFWESWLYTKTQSSIFLWETWIWILRTTPDNCWSLSNNQPTVATIYQNLLRTASSNLYQFQLSNSTGWIEGQADIEFKFPLFQASHVPLYYSHKFVNYVHSDRVK